MLLGISMRSVRLGLWSWIVLSTVTTNRPLPAQELIRLPPRPVTITPAFAPEGLPNQFEEGARPPAAMSTIGGGDTWVACLAYSPDGSTLAVGDRPTRPLCTFLGDAPVNQNGGLIRIVDLATRQVARTIRPEKHPHYEYEVVSVAYTPDGRTLVAHGKEDWPAEKGGREVGYHVTAYDAATGRVLRRIDSAKLDDWLVPVLSRDASTFAALTHKGVRVWDVATGRQHPAPEGGLMKAGALALSPDGQRLAAGSFDQTVKLWNLSERRPLATLVGHGAEVVRVAYAPDGRAVASVDAGGQVRVWDTTTGACRLTLQSLDVPPWLLSFSPDGKSLCCVSVRYGQPVEVCRWDAVTGDRLPSPRLATDAPRPLAFSPDGSLCVSADGPDVRVWDTASGALRSAFSAKGHSLGLLVSRDGETVFQKTRNGSVVTYRRAGGIWNGEDLFASGATWIAMGSEAAGKHMTASPDGRRVALDVDGQVRVFDAVTRRLIALLPPSDEASTWLAFSPDGASLATGRTNGAIFLCRLHETAARVAHP